MHLLFLYELDLIIKQLIDVMAIMQPFRINIIIFITYIIFIILTINMILFN